MKKAAIILVIIVFATRVIFSQPNGGFENWTSSFSSESPVGWQTLNFMQFTIPPNPVSVFKVSGLDKHSGNYALKLKSVYLHNNPIPDILDDTMGVIFTGAINISPSSYRYGFAYGGRPEKLGLWYKYLPVGADEGGVRVMLTRWNGVKQDTVAFGEATFNYNPSYSLFDLTLDYYSSELPDSATIFVASSRHRNVAREGSVLYLDDVEFSGWVGINEAEVYAAKAYPNPAKDNITFSDISSEADVLEITDITSKTVASYKLKNSTQEVNTVFFAEGTYLYTIRNRENKLLYKGKFNVIK